MGNAGVIRVADRLFRNRADAGRVLAELLSAYRGRPNLIVLALPRGGVPVAYEVAVALHSPLDVFLVRKLGVPGSDELAMGAIASGGVVVLNDDVVRGVHVPPHELREVAEREARELLRRERLYRGATPPSELEGMTVILVDDGLATGASMRAAVQALRRRRPARIVVAIPAAPESTCRELSAEVDDVVCATTPSPFLAVGASYWDFTQTTDDEVLELLRAAALAVPATVPAVPTQARTIRSEARPLTDGVPCAADLDELVGDARIVLIGEASHGTHEFYRTRAAITRYLIEHRGFGAVAVEGDWPDAYRVNRWVRGQGTDRDAEEALGGFQRFPTWMWRNDVVLDFVGWLRQHNDDLSGAPERMNRQSVGFYGLDVYSLYRSIAEVIAYLEGVDPAAAGRARERYACLDQFAGDDGQAYGYAAAYGAGETCESEIVDQLTDLQRNGLEYARRDGLLAEDEEFYAEQNARVVKAAAEYYRTMFSGRVSSWNLRDRHMADTLDALIAHLGRHGGGVKIVVWEHNSHLGDARATESGMRGELNVGQLVRERHPGDCRSIGFTTYHGTVTAADDWDHPAERKRVRPGLDGSVEALFHDTGEPEFLLDFARSPHAAEILGAARLERAIGVIYRPRTERQSHYFRARVSAQFDAAIHIDQTRAVEPLERTARWERGEPPETYPFAV
jgi:erythromycin esterase-like protein/predicted phosphoribosyltransferase